jgi:hypothetical protein
MHRRQSQKKRRHEVWTHPKSSTAAPGKVTTASTSMFKGPTRKVLVPAPASIPTVPIANVQVPAQDFDTHMEPSIFDVALGNVNFEVHQNDTAPAGLVLTVKKKSSSQETSEDSVCIGRLFNSDYLILKL